MSDTRAARTAILRNCHALKVGQALNIDARLVEGAFPRGWPGIYTTTREALLAALPGSSWGCFRVKKWHGKPLYTISRHAESLRRVYVDPDRAALFAQMPDGTLSPDEPYTV